MTVAASSTGKKLLVRLKHKRWYCVVLGDGFVSYRSTNEHDARAVYNRRVESDPEVKFEARPYVPRKTKTD